MSEVQWSLCGGAGTNLRRVTEQQQKRRAVGGSFTLSADFGVVADVHAFDQEYDILSDVGRMVRNAFQITGHKNEINSLRHAARVLLHVADKFAVDQIPHFIHRIVGQKNASCQLGILLHECVQGLSNHRLHQVRHMRNIDDRVQDGLVHQGERPLRDIYGEIAHALEVAVDLDRRGYKAQVSRDRLVESKKPGGLLVDLDLHLIDAGLVLQDEIGLVLILFDQCQDAAVDRRLYQPGHCKQALPQIIELFFEMAHKQADGSYMRTKRPGLLSQVLP